MQLTVEKWLNEQLFDEASLKLFYESIICYKAGAYRAGFLFSYLGAQSILKDRIVRGDKPDGVRDHFWTKTLQDLRDDDIWESTLWTAIESKNNGSIFGIGDGHLKVQLEYWRGIRNDCAHAKVNEIISAHVEAYWAFLKSNLPKLVVAGGKDSIINRIQKHFDDKYTPSNADPTPIIKDMAVGVKEDDLDEVFEELDRLTRDDLAYVFWYTASKPASFWKGILELDGSISRKCVEFLINRPKDLVSHVLDAHPHLTAYFSEDPLFVRSLWYEKINNFFNPFELLAALLDNDCIPPEQTEEAITNVIKKSIDTELAPLTLQRLETYGFSQIFKDEVFVGDERKIRNFDWANNHCSLVCSYLIQRGLDTDIVIQISDAYSVSNHAFKLRESLIRLFQEKRELREDFIEIAKEEGLELPEHLGF